MNGGNVRYALYNIGGHMGVVERSIYIETRVMQFNKVLPGSVSDRIRFEIV